MKVIDTTWISVKDKMPSFYKDNVLSNRVTAKCSDGSIKRNVGLFPSMGTVKCYGLTPEHYNDDVTHWKY